MKISDRILGLNGLVKNEQNSQKGDNFTLKFWTGEFNRTAIKIAKELCPQGRVVILSSKEHFGEQVKSLSEQLKRQGFKVTCAIVPKRAKSLTFFSKMFSLPDDVRLIVATDCECAANGFYFASVKNIPIVIPCKDESIFTNFAFRYTIYNGKEKDAYFDYVFTGCKIHVAVDTDLFLASADFSLCYALLMSKLPCLLDYKILRKADGGDCSLQAYDIMFECFNGVFKIFDNDLKNQKICLLYNSLKFLTAYYLSNGECYDFSSVAVLSLLLSSDNANGYALLSSSGIILKLYGEYLSNKYKTLLDLPDYVTRADNLASRFGVDSMQFLSGIKKQLEKINGLEKIDGFEFADALNGENGLYDVKDKLINTYRALGGKDDFDESGLLSVVNSCGDAFDRLNLMSLVRESGILETLMSLA